MRTVWIIAAALTLACSSDTSDTATADCDEATAAIAECYGASAAEQFGASCTPEGAAEVLPLDCVDDNAKADLIQDNWLCRKTGLLCDSTPEFADDIAHFKYASLGAESPGLPRSVVLALPEICPDLWPEDGWAGWGMMVEPGRDLPIGWTTRRIAGVTLAPGNCARCHVSTVRDTPDAAPRVYHGGPGQQIDAVAMTAFLIECLADPRFTRGRLNEVLKTIPGVGLVERAGMVAAAGVFADKARATADEVLYLLQGERAPGPGASDAFNVGAVQLLGWNLNDPPHGNADFGVAWRAAAKPTDLVNWDGNSDDIHESNLSVVLALGASEDSIDHKALERVEAFLDAMPTPEYPYAIDTELAAAGAPLFANLCANCHTRDGERFDTVIAADEIGTDPERAKITNRQLVEAMHEIGAGFDWQFRSFRPSNGYVASRIDGAWLRAPYLHNGSVPNLAALLSPPAERPKTFYRGGDVYDREGVGFVSDQPKQGSRPLFLFDTTQPGKGNGGHIFGTDLPAADKAALLEYLKTI